MISLVVIKIRRRVVVVVALTWYMLQKKDYGSSQPIPGKEPDPPGTPFRIEKPVDKLKATPHIPKEVLKHLGHNPNA